MSNSYKWIGIYPCPRCGDERGIWSQTGHDVVLCGPCMTKKVMWGHNEKWFKSKTPISRSEQEREIEEYSKYQREYRILKKNQKSEKVSNKEKPRIEKYLVDLSSDEEQESLSFEGKISLIYRSRMERIADRYSRIEEIKNRATKRG